MIVTVKTLQQKTFKVEIEDSENVRNLGEWFMFYWIYLCMLWPKC